MDGEPATEAEDSGLIGVFPQRFWVTECKERRIESKDVSGVGSDSDCAPRVIELSVVLASLDLHIVREVLSAKCNGNDPVTGRADFMGVHDGQRRLYPWDQFYRANG